jgi:hypothetical protein
MGNQLVFGQDNGLFKQRVLSVILVDYCSQISPLPEIKLWEHTEYQTPSFKPTLRCEKYGKDFVILRKG